MIKAVLMHGPAASWWHGPSALPSLAAVMERDGHHVVQRSGHIIGTENILRIHGKAEIDRALAIFRDPQSDILARHDAGMTFERVSKGINTPHKFAVESNNVLYVSKCQDGTIEGALAGIKNRESDLWYPYFAEVEIPLALKLRPHLYGISIADERQFMPGIILASMVKEALPGCLVVLGGNYWARVIDAFKLPAFAKFFDYWDAIVYREGYRPLQELAATLDPSKASGTTWRQGNKVVVNPPTKRPVSFETLPPPILDNHVRPLSPETAVSMYTMPGCLEECGFCDIGGGGDDFGSPKQIMLRSMTPRRVAEQIAKIKAARVDFSNEMLPIAWQLALGRALEGIGHTATWQCYMTITDALTRPKVCKDLYDAGCRAVQLGLESLSPDTLTRENKGWNTPSNYGTILKNLKEVGIQTHVFIIVGTPGEPLHQSLAWLAFLEKYGEYILTIKVGRYQVSRLSPDTRENKHSEWIEILPDTHPLRLNRDFKYLHTSRRAVFALRDILEEACRKHKHFGPTSRTPWWVNRGRYRWADFDRMAAVLSKVWQAPSVPHLDRVISRTNTIVKDELGIDPAFRTFDDVVAFGRTLL